MLVRSITFLFRGKTREKKKKKKKKAELSQRGHVTAVCAKIKQNDFAGCDAH